MLQRYSLANMLLKILGIGKNIFMCQKTMDKCSDKSHSAKHFNGAFGCLFVQTEDIHCCLCSLRCVISSVASSSVEDGILAFVCATGSREEIGVGAHPLVAG